MGVLKTETSPETSSKVNLTKLQGARFRLLNEKLYTIDSEAAKSMFKNDKNLSDIYHAGYTEQVKKWPINPVHFMIDFIEHNLKKFIKADNRKVKDLNDETPQPKKPAKFQVADLGCGDAKIGRHFTQPFTQLSEDQVSKIKINSFDLYASPENKNIVTVKDIKNTGLAADSIDLTIFCLSLMGTNLHDFLLEANRILKQNGILKIAEVRSRFENKKVKEKQGIQKFIKGICNLGFYFNKNNETNKISVECLDEKQGGNSHFLILEFKKIKTFPHKVIAEQTKELLKLEPCRYKAR